MLYDEADFLPLSRLADVVFCPRRAVLHLVENIWEDSRHTMIGEHLHAKVHGDNASESRGDVIIARGLRLRSLQLGVSGIADVVEFHASPTPDSGALLPGRQGRWLPFPVEYKKGILRDQECFDVQVCAQAICLEEMLGVSIQGGALFYGASKRRKEVRFDAALRERTASAALELHALMRAGVPPAAGYEPKCKGCSLLEMCMPEQSLATRSVEAYLKSI